MRNALCTLAVAALLAASSSSLALAQSQPVNQLGSGPAQPPAYGNSYAPQPGYGAGYQQQQPGSRPTAAGVRGQPSPTMGIPGGNQPSASSHMTPS